MATLPLVESLAGAPLAGRDFARADLSGMDFSGADLRGANLFQATLDGTAFDGADLRGACLVEAHGERTGFSGANLSGADLSCAQFPDASFVRADLTDAQARTADLSRARFAYATLVQADFTNATMREVELARGPVDGAVFRDANLRDARIRHISGYDRADWVGTDLREADTCGAYAMRRFAHDQNYLEEFWAHGPTHRVIYAVWWATSDCGRSLLRWGSWTAILAAFYAVVYQGLAIDYGAHPTALSPLYFSVVTLTTLGFGDVLPTDVVGQLVVMSEVLFGYFMLGGLLSILSNKMGRRAD